MIDEFDPDCHVFFALPFTKTMASEFGPLPTLHWVSRQLLKCAEPDVATVESLELATQSIESGSIDVLATLDRIAWSHWCCGPVPNQMVQKSICRFIWAVMSHISHANDFKFDSQFGGFGFLGRGDEELKSIYYQAASALNLANDFFTSRTVRSELACNFSNEIQRLQRSAR